MMTDTNILCEIQAQLRDKRVSERVRGVCRIADKRSGHVEKKVDDPRVISILIEALSDSSQRVRRAAARALRPFVADDPGVIHDLLPHYATHTCDGSFTHAGLLDVRDGTVWVPRFAATKGHAALLADGDTDRFFKFEYFVASQVPRRLLGDVEHNGQAHLLLHFILDWSYSRQSLVSPEDGRRINANRREQERYASAVVAFYRSRHLRHPVAVHRLLMQSGQSNAYELNIQNIKPCR